MDAAREAQTFSMEKQEETLREVLNQIAKERGFNNYKLNIKPTTTEGANYTSVLFLATISEQDKSDINIFAKVACIGDKVRADTPYRMFETEIFFYTDLIKTYKNIEDKHDVPVKDRLATPEFYGLNSEYLKETIVMEDLSCRGYQAFDRFKTIDWNYAKDCMTQLAKLHALSMVYSIEQPTEFEEKTKNLKMKKEMRELKELMADTFVKILESARDEHRDRLKHFLEETMTAERTELLVKPIKRVVLTHGDYRPSNLMHKLNEDGTYDVIPLDFQTLNRSNPIRDVLYFIFNGSDKQFRADYYQKTLDHYYSELCASLRRLHQDPNKIYPREHFEDELKQMLPLGLIFSLTVLIMITVKVENVPRISEESLFKDFYFSTSEEYKRRMNDLVEDCIQMGVL